MYRRSFMVKIIMAGGKDNSGIRVFFCLIFFVFICLGADTAITFSNLWPGIGIHSSHKHNPRISLGFFAVGVVDSTSGKANTKEMDIIFVDFF